MKYDYQLERTLILVKPDGIERGLTGEILKRFERKGLKIVAMKMTIPTLEHAQEHYAEHKGNGGFYENICESLTCGPLLAVVLEGQMAIKAARQLIGYSSPIDQSPIGTIRGDLAIYEPKNLVHGSDSHSAAYREIKLWFGEELLMTETPKVEKPKKVKKKKSDIGESFEEIIGATQHVDEMMVVAPEGMLPLKQFIAAPPKKLTSIFSDEPVGIDFSKTKDALMKSIKLDPNLMTGTIMLVDDVGVSEWGNLDADDYDPEPYPENAFDSVA